MYQYNNPYGNQNPRDMWKRFYSMNKIPVWIMGGALVSLILLGAPFLTILYVVYMIYFGSVLFKQFFNDEKLIRTFIFAGLSGVALYILFFNSSIMLFPLLIVFISSGSISLLTAAATYAPDMEVMLAFFGRVKIKWLTLIIIGIDILTINPAHPSARIADLGGIIYGFLSIYLPARRTFGKGLDFGKFFKKRGPYYKKPQNKTKTRSTRTETDEAYNLRKKQEQKEIDRILEKIKYSGYDSLTSEEKRKLFDQSKK